MEHSPILPASAAVESAERFLPTNIGIEPLSAVARALSGFNRDQLGSAVEVLIALMDVADGEPDLESATDVEDDFAVSPMAEHFATGPGCVLADSDTAAWEEWHTRGNRKAYPPGVTFNEDDEEDDAAEEDDEAGQCTEDELSTNLHAQWATGAGCVISDLPEEDDDPGQSTEDEVSYNSGPSMWGNGPGCPISDPGGCQHDGRELDDGL